MAQGEGLAPGERPAFTVFTKPWKEASIEQLAAVVSDLEIEGVELPVRDGYQVASERIDSELVKAARTFERYGLKIGSVATEVSERAIAACGDAGVPLIRTMVNIDLTIGYRATEESVRRRWDALLPALERFGVAIGVQNHCGAMVGSAVGIMHLIEGYDPRRVGAVLDPAHCGLDGEPEAMAIDIVWSHLLLVNLKNALWVRETGAGPEEARWRTCWTGGRDGLTSWKTVASELVRRGYRGDICFTAEYSDPHGRGDLTEQSVNPLVRSDIEYAKSLFEAK